MHEMLHDLSGTQEYQELANFVKERAMTHDTFEEAKQTITDKYTKYYQENGLDMSNLNMDVETVNDMTAQALGNQEFLNELAGKKPNVFMRIYNWVKNVLFDGQKTGKTFSERRADNKYLNELKKKFETAYNTAYKGNGTSTSYHVSENLSNDLDNVLNNLNERNPVKLRDFTPDVLVQNGVKNLPMYENPSHIRKNILTNTEAQQLGLQISNRDHYHGLGKETYIKAIDSLDDPRVVLKYKNIPNQYIILTVVKDAQNNNIIVPIEVETTTFANNIKIDTNRVKSVYGYDRMEPDLNKYIKDSIKNNNLEKIYEKKKPSTGKTLQSTSNYSIPSTDGTVNNQYMQNNGNNTQGLEKSSSFSLPEIPKKHIRLYRGLNNKYDKNYDRTKLDNVNGYESWTDNYELAKQYGENVYYTDIPLNKVGNDIIDQDGERFLVYKNNKPVGLNNVSGNEYMLYTGHDDFETIRYHKKIPDILENLTDIVIGTKNKDGEVVRYVKEYEDNNTFIVEVVPDKGNNIIIKTMYQKLSYNKEAIIKIFLKRVEESINECNLT